MRSLQLPRSSLGVFVAFTPIVGLVKLRMKSGPDAVCPHQRLAMDPRCKGMPLSSFLLKPMQRVTRYPLIIKNVRTALKTHHAPTHSGALRLSALTLMIKLPRIQSVSFFFLSVDLRKHSRVASGPQPPESCSGEG